MSEGLSQDITALEAQLEGHRQAMAAIESGLAPLRAHYLASSGTPTLTPAAPTLTPLEARPRRVKPPVPSPASDRPAASGGKTDAILALLKEKSPRSPRELAKALKIDRALVRFSLKPLVDAGRVHLTGATISREIHLGPARGGKTTTPEAFGRTFESAARVEPPRDRDAEILTMLQGALPAGRSVRELQIVFGGTPEEIQAALQRLATAKRVVKDEGGKWIAR